MLSCITSNGGLNNLQKRELSMIDIFDKITLFANILVPFSKTICFMTVSLKM